MLRTDFAAAMRLVTYVVNLCCGPICIESVCYTADDEDGDARTGLHRVSNAIAGAFALCMLCSAALVFVAMLTM